MHIIIGLGNPGEEYAASRHNTGRMILETFRKGNDCSEWEEDKKKKTLVAEGKVGKEKILLIEPNNFMNNSGKSVAAFVKPLNRQGDRASKKQAAQTIVIYDDLDLPIGMFKISWNRGSGGHRGLDSIIRALKTREFVRIRIGISPATPSGKIKKPSGEKEVIRFIMGAFSPKDRETLKKVSKKISEALATIVLDGREKAMSEWN